MAEKAPSLKNFRTCRRESESEEGLQKAKCWDRGRPAGERAKKAEPPPHIQRRSRVIICNCVCS